MLERPPRLVIFDLDGTLVDSLPATFTCFAEAVAPALGRYPSKEEILARMGAADQRIVADWAGPEHAEEAVRRLYACYAREFAGLAPVPGVVGLLRDLRAAGRQVGLFTGRGRPSTEVMLRSLGLVDLFDASVTGEEVPRSKPAPDGLAAILARTGIAAAAAVYVGDSPLDVAAARSAGVTPIAALWGSHQREELDAIDGLIEAETVDELRRILGV